MRKFILGTAILLALLWIYLICVNTGTQTAVYVPFYNLVTIKTSWLMLGFGLFTVLIDGLSVIWYLMTKTDINRNYQIKMDKMSVEADSDKSQVKILENKIKTLEAVIEKLTKKD